MWIVCECGATKSDWRVMDGDKQIEQIVTDGINVSTMSEDAIGSKIVEAVSRMPSGEYGSVFFYAAGVLSPTVSALVTSLLIERLGAGNVEIQTDLIAAARAACGHEPGIAAILGTGSSTCQFDGRTIVKRVNAGGFILGDDGSASVIGKLFISDFIKGLVPSSLSEEFSSAFDVDYPTIVKNVYNSQGSPSGYLGSFCPFIIAHYRDPYVERLVDGSLRAFIERNLRQYEIDKYPVGVIGGFGYAIRDILAPLFEEYGIKVKGYFPSPIEELVKYHLEDQRNTVSSICGSSE